MSSFIINPHFAALNLDEGANGTAWDSAFKDADHTLSNSDWTSTTTGVGLVIANSPILVKSQWEYSFPTHTGGNIIVGVCSQATRVDIATVQSTSVGNGYNSNGAAAAPLNVTYTAGDVITVVYDPATGEIWYAKNGTWLGNDPSGAGAITLASIIRGLTMYPYFSMSANGGSATLISNSNIFTEPLFAGCAELEQAALPNHKFSDTDKNANMTLSASNTIATKSSTGHANAMLGVRPVYGKEVYAFELIADGAGSTAKCVGILDSSDSRGALMGGNGFGIGYRSGGTVVRNNSTLQTYTAWGTVGDIIQVAVDYSTKELWFGLNDSWNGDPAAGTGEVGQWPDDGTTEDYGYIGVGATDSGDAFEFITYPYSVPSGFTARGP
jgi:hypothetical protein